MNRLSFDKTERTQACHLKKALQLPTTAESCCSPFTLRELDKAIHALRRKGAAGPDDIPPTFLKALSSMANTELLSIFNEGFSKGAVPGIWKEATILPLKKSRQITGGHLLLPTCQPHILCCHDNGEIGAQPVIQPSGDKKMALQRTGWLPRYLNPSTSSKGSPSSRTAWRCSPGMSADITLVFEALMCMPTAAALMCMPTAASSGPAAPFLRKACMAMSSSRRVKGEQHDSAVVGICSAFFRWRA